LIELDDGTKESYDVFSKNFSDYEGTVDASEPYINRFFTWVTTEDSLTTGPWAYCDNGITQIHEYWNERLSKELQTLFFGSTKKIQDLIAFDARVNGIADLTACCTFGPSSSVSFNGMDLFTWDRTEWFHVGHWHFGDVQQPNATPPNSYYPYGLTIPDEDKFLVLSYASSRQYNGQMCRGERGGTYSWTDKIVFCEDGVCQEFETVSDSTTDPDQRHTYLISDYQVYIFTYSTPGNVFASVFKAGGSYYCFIGKDVDGSFTVARDTTFEDHYDGKNIVKISFPDYLDFFFLG
jgi:hypothetical protein